jgi:hypothetical protein
MNHHSIFGIAWWPTKLGNACNNNVGQAIATAQGQALWSVPLPSRSAGGIVVAGDGRLFVSSRSRLTAVEPDGVVTWRIESEGLMGNPVVLADGCLLMVENGGYEMVIREQATGTVVCSWPVNTSIALQPTVTRLGWILYNQYQPREKCSQLAVTSLSGELLWSRPLAQTLYDPPLVVDNLIIVRDGAYLRAYSADGTLQWIANRDGFEMADTKTQAQLATKQSDSESDEIYTPLIWLGNHQILAGLGWYSGYGLHIFDICQRTIRRWHSQLPGATYLPPKKPLATPLHKDKGLVVVTVGWQKRTMMFDLAGNIIWEHQEPHGEAQSIIADASGKVFVTSSPSWQIWDLYKDYYNLVPQCFLRGFSPDGKELFTWVAPGPISRSLALGKAGELYLVSDGHLWAIA